MFHRNLHVYFIDPGMESPQPPTNSTGFATCLPVLTRGAGELTWVIGWRPLGSGVRVGR